MTPPSTTLPSSSGKIHTFLIADLSVVACPQLIKACITVSSSIPQTSQVLVKLIFLYFLFYWDPG
jgi:hypothetical protein